jgi:four helix bundle protein
MNQREPFRFLHWQVYKNAKKLFKLVYDIVNKLSKNIRFELGSQIVRACFSVILNIAEGSGKSSDKELKRYFDIPLGSLNETIAGMDVLRDNKLIENTPFKIVLEKSTVISKQLGGFKKKL